MGAFGGPNIKDDGLVFALDAGNTKGTIRSKQSSNILVDPHTWTTGTGSFSGYGANGSSSEQNRLYVNDDPWGRRSVTWRTTPDATSGADGGWNTSYYSIDRSYTYRWSVWVRRYTTGTGGTFYLGLNPAPIRNDNGNTQGNPYFTYVGISGLTYNQWYLVVGHCFYEGYSGGRHPDSGWYQNGVKISDKSYGNVGTQDVRWASNTTTAMHRAYHFYTTNTASGIEFAFPRLDKCDGNEPSIKELIEIGESGYLGLVKGRNFKTYNGLGFGQERKNVGYFNFDGSNDYIDTGSDIIISPDNQGWTAEYWFNTSSASTLQHFNSAENDEFNANWLAIYNSKLAVWNRSPGYWRYGSTTIQSNKWYQAVFVCDPGGTNYRYYINGVREGGNHVNNVWNATYSSLEVRYVGRYEFSGSYSRYFVGKMGKVNMWNRALSGDEVFRNYVSQRSRFGI